MDPIANLNEQLSIARQTIEASEQIAAGDDVSFTVSDESLRLAELVIAQHEWRTKGGFDPYTGGMPEGVVLTAEVVLPDGTAIRWAQGETDARTTDRLIDAIKRVIGAPDTIKP